MNSLRRLRIWITALIRWLFVQPRLLWVGLSVSAVSLVLALVSGSEPHVRWIGLFLQLAGLATVAIGVRETRRLFDRPSVLRLARFWISSFPRWPRDQTVQAAGISAGSVAVSGRVEVWCEVDSEAPVREQLDALAENTQRLREQIRQLDSDLRNVIADDADSLRGEAQKHAKQIGELRDRLEAAEVGGIYISVMGLVWIFFGLILAGVSQEIAQLLS